MYSRKSFICALTSLLVIIPMSFALMKLVRDRDSQLTQIVAISIALASLVAVAGLIFAIMGRKEQHSGKKVFSMVWNGAVTCLLLFGLIFNVSYLI